MQPIRMKEGSELTGSTGPTQKKPISSTKAPKGFGSPSASRGNIATGQSQMAKKCEEGIKGQTKMTKFGC